jgi:hypothetical protein
VWSSLLVLFAPQKNFFNCNEKREEKKNIFIKTYAKGGEEDFFLYHFEIR